MTVPAPTWVSSRPSAADVIVASSCPALLAEHHVITNSRQPALLVYAWVRLRNVHATRSKKSRSGRGSIGTAILPLALRCRAILLRPASWAKHSFGPWLTAAAKRLHHNVLATALANKLARIAWMVLAQRRNYETRSHSVTSRT